MAEIIYLDNEKIKFKIINTKIKNANGILVLKNLKWSIPKKKSIKDVHKIGDIIFVKKNNNYWTLKQYPNNPHNLFSYDSYAVAVNYWIYDKKRKRQVS